MAQPLTSIATILAPIVALLALYFTQRNFSTTVGRRLEFGRHIPLFQLQFEFSHGYLAWRMPLLSHGLAVAFIEVNRLTNGRKRQVLSPAKQPVLGTGFDGFLLCFWCSSRMALDGFSQNPAIHPLRRLNPQNPKDRRHEVRVARREFADKAAAKIRTRGNERIVHIEAAE